jgi:hypothetical protein
MYLNFLNADLDLGFKFIETAKLAGSDSAVGLMHFAVSLLVEDTVRIQGERIFAGFQCKMCRALTNRRVISQRIRMAQGLGLTAVTCVHRQPSRNATNGSTRLAPRAGR